MVGDFLHPGHINIIKNAADYGEVTVGLFTDKAVASFKRVPLLNYEQREEIIKNIKGVDRIIPQKTADFRPNLLELKPDFVIHGDDWDKGVGNLVRKQVLETLSVWGGELIEVEYTKGFSSTDLIEQYLSKGVTPHTRRRKLRELLELKPIVRVLEAHNGLTGRIVETVLIKDNETNLEFDAMWASSLTDSTAKGKPDTELVGWSSRFATIEDILEVTTKPMIVDGDTGGRIEHFKYTVKTLERLGVSAVIIEDKKGYKRNSLFGLDVNQEQDSVERFSEKISQGKKSQITKDFMIIARVESLILKKGLEDALTRASSYIDAGADGIMIHSKEEDGKEIYDFCKAYHKFDNIKPLVVVPSTYSHIKEEEFIEWGVNVVIYANHLLRASYPSMIKTAESILRFSRAKEASDKYCLPIKEIINLIPEEY